MVTTEVEAPGRATVTQRWLARLSLVAVAAAVLVAPLVAGFRQSLALVLVGLAGLALTSAGVWYWWRWGCWRWVWPLAGPRWPAMPSPSGCANTTSHRPGGPI